METNLLGNPNYRKRAKATRTRLFKQIWQQLEQASSPKGFRWLFKEQIHIEPGYRALLQAAGLDSVQGVFNSTVDELVTTGGEFGGEDVSRIRIQDGSVQRTFYIKRYWNRELRRMWKRAFRGSILGASIMKREFSKMKELDALGIPTLKLVAWGDQRFCAGVINTFMITEELPHATGVDSLATTWFTQTGDTQLIQWQNSLIAEAARHLRKMHQHGFEHHDLFFRNIMVSDKEPLVMYIFDCPRAFRWPTWLMKYRCVQDLATLDAAASAVFTPSQRMRFMHLYLDCKRLNTEQKSLVRKILRKADPNRKRQRKRLERAC